MMHQTREREREKNWKPESQYPPYFITDGQYSRTIYTDYALYQHCLFRQISPRSRVDKKIEQNK